MLLYGGNALLVARNGRQAYSGPMTKTMNDGSKATIIRIISTNAVDVQFEDGFVLKHARLTQFNKGTLKGHHTNTNV